MMPQRGHIFYPDGRMEPFNIHVTVVVPTCRRPHLLLRCLSALIRQDFPNNHFDIIVVSDGEDEETKRAIEPFVTETLPHVRYYALPVKAGPAAARNFGLLLSRGVVVAFTDDDCIPAAGWLTAMWSAYQKENKKDIAFSGATLVPIQEKPTDYERNISNLGTAEFITANCACSREALYRVGGFDERFTMAWREDSDLHFKLIEADIPMVKVHNAIVTHPVREAAWGISLREEKKGMFNALLFKKFPGLYRKKIQPSPPWTYYAITFFIVSFILGSLSDRRLIRSLGLSGWLLLTGAFAFKRLRNTSKSGKHVLEMLFTSALIPLLSLYWRFYGAWKYKALLIP